MKILTAHNFYQQSGGEDIVVAAESEQLRASGHTVLRYSRHNDRLHRLTFLGSLKTGFDTVWSSRSYHDFEKLLAQEKPGVAHFHNTFPLISPSAYYACAKAGVPVVQTLHNYRLLCPSATFLREGAVCELCLGRLIPWPGVLHACYRESRAATATVAAMLTAHRAMKTWQTKVNVYVALSEFARRKFVEGGLPTGRIVVKPNFVRTDPGSQSGRGEYALFVGRLSSEKGVNVLAEGWAALSNPVPLRIVGDGPLFEEVGKRLRQKVASSITMSGRLSSEDVLSSMRSARFLVLPSICYENFPLAAVEAFACGVPVVASRLGAMAEIVDDGRTGLHFNAGDAADLATKVEWAWSHPQEMEAMGRAARAEYEAKYTAERNCKMLVEIYERVIAGYQSDRSLSEPSILRAGEIV